MPSPGIHRICRCASPQVSGIRHQRSGSYLPAQPLSTTMPRCLPPFGCRTCISITPPRPFTDASSWLLHAHCIRSTPSLEYFILRLQHLSHHPTPPHLRLYLASRYTTPYPRLSQKKSHSYTRSTLTTSLDSPSRLLTRQIPLLLLLPHRRRPRPLYHRALTASSYSCTLSTLPISSNQPSWPARHLASPVLGHRPANIPAARLAHRSLDAALPRKHHRRHSIPSAPNAVVPSSHCCRFWNESSLS